MLTSALARQPGSGRLEPVYSPRASRCGRSASPWAGITGTGTYVQEAGRAGTLQVVGTYHRPSINLSLHYDFSQDPAYYVGTVQDGSHIAGALRGLSVPLVRQ